MTVQVHTQVNEYKRFDNQQCPLGEAPMRVWQKKQTDLGPQVRKISNSCSCRRQPIEWSAHTMGASSMQSPTPLYVNLLHTTLDHDTKHSAQTHNSENSPVTYHLESDEGSSFLHIHTTVKVQSSTFNL